MRNTQGEGQQHSSLELKTRILDFLREKKASRTAKTRHYFREFQDLLPDEDARHIKTLLTEMVQEGTLVYWSSGSTTLYALREASGQDEENPSSDAR
ncbi:MAG: dissimilatory sulfite reductase D family protein [Desulfovibrionaceae bacterium]|nr:dissimilatory sulfite reductase D family protein [Desulfovibrionaceae bacterium]